jgi:hypothetical protein
MTTCLVQALYAKKKGKSRNVKRLLQHALTLLLVLIFFPGADSHASSDTSMSNPANTAMRRFLFGCRGAIE